MDEKLISQIYELTMNEPGINLMEEDLVAHEKNAGEHVLNHWVTTNASLMKRIQ